MDKIDIQELLALLGERDVKIYLLEKQIYALQQLLEESLEDQAARKNHAEKE